MLKALNNHCSVYVILSLQELSCVTVTMPSSACLLAVFFHSLIIMFVSDLLSSVVLPTFAGSWIECICRGAGLSGGRIRC